MWSNATPLFHFHFFIPRLSHRHAKRVLIRDCAGFTQHISQLYVAWHPRCLSLIAMMHWASAPRSKRKYCGGPCDRHITLSHTFPILSFSSAKNSLLCCRFHSVNIQAWCTGSFCMPHSASCSPQVKLGKLPQLCSCRLYSPPPPLETLFDSFHFSLFTFHFSMALYQYLLFIRLLSK